jgi:hypothetical protein
VKLQIEAQKSPITDQARARIGIALPILKGILFSLKRDRVSRLGGYEKITIEDLAREYREGAGDCGICFEYAVHEAIKNKDKNIWSIISEVLEDNCKIKGGAHSILFGAEKAGVLDLIDTPSMMINDDTRVLAGTIGQPAKLQKHWDKIRKAMNNVQQRLALPVSINGLWKSDLFLGNPERNRWVGTSLKLNPSDFEEAAGLRIGIYPEKKPGERPSKNRKNNLIMCPLPYNANFMELFYSSFFTVKQFILADAKLPAPVKLPNGSDRIVAQQLEDRRSFTVLDVLEAMEPLGQPDLLDSTAIGNQDNKTSAVAPIPLKTV